MTMAIIYGALYVICGAITAISGVVEKTNNGEFNPYSADEDDEEAIGTIVLLWPAYIIQRLMNKGGDDK